MAISYKVLCVGGDRAVQVGLSRAFQAAGATFASAADPTNLVDSAARFNPHLVLVVGRPDPDAAMKHVHALRADERFAKLPVLLVSSLPPSDAAGATAVVPDPSDTSDFATRMLRALAASLVPVVPGPARPAEATRLLFVDDDPALLKLYSKSLTKAGFEVLTATDGNLGLAATIEHRPDLILADLNMPHLDGWGFLRALRADYRVDDTPLVFLSAHDDYRESLKAFSAGAQGYLAKGGRLDGILTQLNAVLAPRAAFAAALEGGGRVTARVEELGPSWAVRRIATAGHGGRVSFKDEFWQLELALSGAELVFARATIGPQVLDGARALAPLMALRHGELAYDPAGKPPDAGNASGLVAELLEKAAVEQNEKEAAALDRLLTGATRVKIDPQLYELHDRLGAPLAREVASMLNQGLTPKQVISQSSHSPLEVDEVVRDLVRRRVIRLA